MPGSLVEAGQDLQLAPVVPRPVPHQPRRARGGIGSYLLALLPLLVTLFFLLFQFTALGDACPADEPCLGPADFGEP